MKHQRIFFLLGMFLLAIAASGAKVIKDKTYIDRSFQGIKTVKVVQSVLTVNIVGNTSDKTAVKCHVDLLETDQADYTVEARVVGSTLEIYERTGSNRRGFSCRQAKGTIAISIPRGVRVVSVTNVSGDASVRGCHLDNLSIKTVSGDVRLLDTVSELAVVSCVSGDVKIGSSKGNKITVNTVSGDVIAKGEKSGVDFSLVSFSSTSGDIAAYLGSSVRQTVFKSVSGDIHLYFKGDLMRNAYSLTGLSSDIVISGHAKAERKLELQPENPLVDVRAAAVSGDIYVSNYR